MTHAVLGAAWLPAGFFVAGWMLRDIGLWHGPVVGGWLRWLVVAGAGIQVLAALAAVLAVVIVGGLRLAWGTRSLASARFSWPVESPGVPATRKREPAHSARPGHR